MRPLLLLALIVSLLGVRMGTVDAAPIGDGSAVLQRLVELEPETVSARAIADAYSDLDGVVSAALAHFGSDGAVMRRLTAMHASAEETALAWRRRCETSSAPRDCDRASEWEQKRQGVLLNIEVSRQFGVEAAHVSESLAVEREQSISHATAGDEIAAVEILRSSLATVQDLLTLHRTVP